MKPATATRHAVDISEADVRQSLAGRANRYDVVSRLADDLAHEIKNPLNAIVVNLEVLRRRIESNAAPAALDRTDVIDHEIKRVHQLVEQLLQLVRPGKDEKRVLALDELLADLAPLLELQAKAARARFELQVQSEVYINQAPEVIKFAVLNVMTAIYAASAVEHIKADLGTSDAFAVLTIASTPALVTEDEEFVRAARSLLESIGGTLELTNGAVRLCCPLSSSFA
jgi:signal transduction histidine kinase